MAVKFLKVLEERGGLITALRKTPCRGPWHPEETRMAHVDILIGRYLQSYENAATKYSLNQEDLNTVRVVIWFHDLGCIHCTQYNESTDSYTAYGHEKISYEMMEEFHDVIEEYGANYDRARWLVLNHMKAHFYVQGQLVKPAKREALENHPDFNLLMWIQRMDDMLLDFDGEIHC